ncbi:YoaK family protein, partial [Kitasatospora sp. MBT63]
MTTPAIDPGAAGRPEPPLPGTQVHDRHPLALALFALTAVSGLIDAVSYLGLGHVFTANMTGNVVVIAFALAGAPGFSVTGSVTSLAAFLLGAGLAGRLVARSAAPRRDRWLRTALLLEVALHGAAAAVVFAWGVTGSVQYAVIALLAVAMGIRNGAVRGLGVPDL